MSRNREVKILQESINLLEVWLKMTDKYPEISKESMQVVMMLSTRMKMASFLVNVNSGGI